MLAIVFASYFGVANLTGRGPQIPTAHAYWAEYRWGGQPNPHVCCAQFYVYYNSVNNYPSYDRLAFDNGRAAWNNSPALTTLISTTAATPFHVSVYSMQSDGMDGHTNWQVSGTTPLGATSWVNDFFLAGYSTAARQSVAAHELGHGQGLGDITGNFSCANMMLMYYATNPRFYPSCGVNIPKSDDINGINSMY